MILLVLALLVLPIAELYVIVQVSAQIGFWNTLGIMVLVAVAGAWLIRHQGTKAWIRFNEQIARGQVPTRELLDGVCIVLAGLLLITPGFLTDVAGLLLLLPPTRALARAVLVRRVRRSQAAGRVRVIRAAYDRSGRMTVTDVDSTVTDTTATEVRGELDP
jgi:UPF0716 protein FxsA